MKHSSTREVFAHWSERRGVRLQPERGEIEPSAMRKSLGDAFILGMEPGAEPRFRLAGTRVCALFGRELRDEPFSAVWQETHRSSIRRLLALVIGEATGVVAGARGRTCESFSTELELLLLPLSHRGKPGQRMVGVLAPFTAPYWLGSTRLDSLSLGSFRHVGAAAEAVAPSRLAALAGREASRPQLVIHDGGRS
jgi:hypothetical protein